MKTAVQPDLKPKASYIRKTYYIRQRKKEIFLDDFKFYQKLFVVLISLSTFLIFPESPRELENICLNYNSGKLCDVW